MCGRYTIAAGAEFIGPYFDIEGPLPEFHPSYNVTPGSDAPVIWQAPADGRACSLMHWGLIPHWAKEPSSKYKMINAKAETLAERPAYRSAYKHRRCLIPTSGFYEWHSEAHGKQPYFIRMKQAPLFAFAGLWEYWEGEHTINSFTIITTPANELVGKIHERMPAIMLAENYNTWLDPNFGDESVLQELLQPVDSALLQMYAVSTAVNNPINDSADLIKPL